MLYGVALICVWVSPNDYEVISHHFFVKIRLLTNLLDEMIIVDTLLLSTDCIISRYH